MNNNNYNSKIENKKGISLLFAILILSFVLSVALGGSVIMVRQLKSLREAGHSVMALYAADTGIEEILFKDDPTGGIAKTSLPPPLDNAEYEVFVEAGGEGNCDSSLTFCVTSVGTYQNTRRAIEVQY